MVGNHSLLGVTEAQYQFLTQQYPRVEKFHEKLAKKHAALTTIPKKLIHRHVLGTPLLEVLCVKIVNDDGSAGAYQVYGTIVLIDGEGAAFNLYDRGEADAETVTVGGSLTLVMPKGRAMCASGRIYLQIQLKDATQRAVFANGLHSWDYDSKDDYDVVQTKKFGSAVMECITYRHADIATIDIIFVRGTSGRDDGDFRGRIANGGTVEEADVYGEVIAHCCRNYSITLFKRTENESVRLRLGSTIELLRHVVVVPSCSSLVVVPNLRYLDTKENIVSKIVMFDAIHDSFGLGVQRDVDGENDHICVEVDWSHAYMQPQLKRKLKDTTISDSEVRKRAHLASPEQDVADLNGNRGPHALPVPEYYDDAMVEVFSVTIGSAFDEEPFENVHGTIKFRNNERVEEFIFNKGLENGTRVLSNQHLELMTPKRRLFGSDVVFDVDLEDGDGRVISHGHVFWTEVTTQQPIDWYGKHLCSIVRGNIGYAALHYMLIPNGVLATVRVCIKRGGRNNHTITPPPSDNVRGSIFAEYSECKYATWYDKEHYRHRLFQSEEEVDMTMPCSGLFEVALKKSAVVVPRTSALIIDLDLTLEGTGSPSSFRGRLTFSIEMDRGRELSIKGSCGNAIAEVSVLWSEVSREISTPKHGDGVGFDLDSALERSRDQFFAFSLYDDDSDSDLWCSQYLGSPVTMQVLSEGI
ncbi:hypothetical protein DM860_008661 [Cuscuta australis]|uniref:DUF6598 domain-containing protein n=1 Tax=Cuscuta australis TaxID=267555 RepID=A0A328DAJ9_9ASTE|nr:hypothetical protein DM860_008661 [Cuscuta australis]